MRSEPDSISQCEYPSQMLIRHCSIPSEISFVDNRPPYRLGSWAGRCKILVLNSQNRRPHGQQDQQRAEAVSHGRLFFSTEGNAEWSGYRLVFLSKVVD